MALSECVFNSRRLVCFRNAVAMQWGCDMHTIGRSLPFGPCYAAFVQSYSSVLVVVMVVLSVM